MSLWDSLVGALPAIASIGGAIIGSNANTEAAEIAAAANDRAIAASNARYEDLKRQTQPAQTYLSTVMGQGDQLTPAQLQEMDDLRRQTTNRLATSGLRGSGRATVSALRAVESDYRNKALDANRRRADAAAGTQAGAYYSTFDDQAALDRQGVNSGLYSAGATTANASLTGSALGDIASLIASDNKGRASRYRNENPWRDPDKEPV